MAVKNRFEVLRRQKEAAEERDITLKEIASALGVSRQTLDKYKKNQMEFVNLDVVQALCDYFKCDIADFLYIDRSGHQSEAQ
jgi:DNA-binding Xre family transcriptional regulator